MADLMLKPPESTGRRAFDALKAAMEARSGAAGPAPKAEARIAVIKARMEAVAAEKADAVARYDAEIARLKQQISGAERHLKALSAQDRAQMKQQAVKAPAAKRRV